MRGSDIEGVDAALHALASAVEEVYVENSDGDGEAVRSTLRDGSERNAEDAGDCALAAEGW